MSNLYCTCARDVPEITVNLLDELALEEPHFQKVCLALLVIL